MLKISSISQLNDACIDNSVTEIIKVAEALQEKKIANVADMIQNGRDRIRLVLIAGPSSSGKTTFTKRLAVQLRVTGIRPVMLSMDNYYVDRVDTPKNPDGSYNFECIEALDVPLFNEHMKRLLAGERVDTPIFDFVSGMRRTDKFISLKLESDQVMLIEGIHGLNPRLTASISNDSKFRIYVSALTQLMIDEHNRIFTSDLRLMRRIVRDRLYRGYLAGDTIRQWPSVRAGENEYIFPFQNEADVMFDTSLVYEPAVLKPYLRRFLMEVKPEDPSYVEAFRLFNFLALFIPIFPHEVPNNSLLREFIGGSAFDY
jgi:uridine kinase